jgi:hypothetical protein
MVGTVLVTVHLEQHVGIAIMANDVSAASEALVREIAEYVFRQRALGSLAD